MPRQPPRGSDPPRQPPGRRCPRKLGSHRMFPTKCLLDSRTQLAGVQPPRVAFRSFSATTRSCRRTPTTRCRRSRVRRLTSLISLARRHHWRLVRTLLRRLADCRPQCPLRGKGLHMLSLDNPLLSEADPNPIRRPRALLAVPRRMMHLHLLACMGNLRARALHGTRAADVG